MRKNLASVALTCLLMLGVSVNAMAGAAATDLVCNGCVGTTDVANAAVTETKLGTNAVTNTKIANGAVTDAKISGQISASKIQKPSNLIVVATSGGDFTTISAALASLPDPNTTPTLIKVMPGTYTEQVTMKPHVTIVGSGQENTKITSTALYTLKGADNTTIENIWINNDYVDTNGPGYGYYSILNEDTAMNIINAKVTIPLTSMDWIIGIQNTGTNSKLSITHSTIEIENKVGVNGKYATGINAAGGSVTVSDSVINMSGVDAMWTPAIWGNFTMRDTVVRCDGSLWNECVGGSNSVISNSSIEAIGQANAEYTKVIRVSGTITNSKIILSGTSTASDCAVEYGQIGGSLIQGPICGTPKIVNSWDGNFDPIVYPPLP